LSIANIFDIIKHMVNYKKLSKANIFDIIKHMLYYIKKLKKKIVWKSKINKESGNRSYEKQPRDSKKRWGTIFDTLWKNVKVRLALWNWEKSKVVIIREIVDCLECLEKIEHLVIIREIVDCLECLEKIEHLVIIRKIVDC
jgi:hypothetical protein